MKKLCIPICLMILMSSLGLAQTNEEDINTPERENFNRLIAYYESMGPDYPRIPDGMHSITLVGRDFKVENQLVVVENNRVSKKIIERHKYYDEWTDLSSTAIQNGKVQIREGNNFLDGYFISYLESGEKVAEKAVAKNDTIEFIFNHLAVRDNERSKIDISTFSFFIKGKPFQLDKSNIEDLENVDHVEIGRFLAHSWSHSTFYKMLSGILPNIKSITWTDDSDWRERRFAFLFLKDRSYQLFPKLEEIILLEYKEILEKARINRNKRLVQPKRDKLGYYKNYEKGRRYERALADRNFLEQIEQFKIDHPEIKIRYE